MKRRQHWLTWPLLLLGAGIASGYLHLPLPTRGSGVIVETEAWMRGARNISSQSSAGTTPTASGSRAPASLPASSGEGQVPPLLAFMRKNFPGDWVANYNDKGQLNGVTGGSIPKGATDPARAFALAVELGKLQGIRQEELDSRNRSSAESEVQDIYEFQQTYEGYKVFGSSIRLNAAKADGTVYHVSTSLSEIAGEEFELGLQKQDVAETIRRLYPGRTVTGVKFVEKSPVIWARSSPQELAWVVSVDFKDEKLDRVRVVLGSKTSTIRGETSQLME